MFQYWGHRQTIYDFVDWYCSSSKSRYLVESELSCFLMVEKRKILCSKYFMVAYMVFVFFCAENRSGVVEGNWIHFEKHILGVGFKCYFSLCLVTANIINTIFLLARNFLWSFCYSECLIFFIERKRLCTIFWWFTRENDFEWIKDRAIQ